MLLFLRVEIDRGAESYRCAIQEAEETREKNLRVSKIIRLPHSKEGRL